MTAPELVRSAALQWHHNEQDGVSNHRRVDGLLNRLFRHRSKKTSKLCATGLCEGNSSVTGEFPSQRASDAELWCFLWWRHHGKISPVPAVTYPWRVWVKSAGTKPQQSTTKHKRCSEFLRHAEENNLFRAECIFLWRWAKPGSS